MSRHGTMSGRFEAKYGGGMSKSSYTGPSPGQQAKSRRAMARVRASPAYKARAKAKTFRGKTVTFARRGGKATGGYMRKGRFHPGGSKSFNAKVRNVVMEQLTADNSFVSTYADQMKAQGANNAVAVGAGWAINQVASVGLAAGVTNNLQLDDPQILTQLLNNISATKTAEMTRKTAEVSLLLTNCETACVELWEYRCKARRSQVLTPDLVFRQGFGIAQTGLNGKPTYQTVGATPFQNPEFTSNYKITKVKKFVLAPSESVSIKYSYKRPRKFTAQQLNEANAAGVSYWNVLKGQSVSLFMANGTFATNSGSNATYKVGISNINIGMVYKIRYHYSWINDVSIATGNIPNLPGFQQGSGGAPAPYIITHPDSAVATETYGGVTDIPTAVTAGTRVYDTGGNEFTVPDEPESET